MNYGRGEDTSYLPRWDRRDFCPVQPDRCPWVCRGKAQSRVASAPSRRDATAGSALDGALSRRKNRRHRWTGHPHRSAGILVRTVACPVPPEARPRLRGARPGTAQPPRLPAPLVVTRRVSVRGAIMVGGQRIQVGLAHARKTVAVTVGPSPSRSPSRPASPSPRPGPLVGTSDGTRHRTTADDRRPAEPGIGR